VNLVYPNLWQLMPVQAGGIDPFGIIEDRVAWFAPQVGDNAITRADHFSPNTPDNANPANSPHTHTDKSS
jgi:hypothetical protein